GLPKSCSGTSPPVLSKRPRAAGRASPTRRDGRRRSPARCPSSRASTNGRKAFIRSSSIWGLKADCIGAVGVRPVPGAELPNEAAAEVTASPGRTISGIQRKLLVVKRGNSFTPAGPTGFAPYIAKFNHEGERVGSLVRNELLSLRWCAELLGKG